MLANVLHDVPIIIKQPSDIVHYLPPEMVPPSVSSIIFAEIRVNRLLLVGFIRDAAWSTNANCSRKTGQSRQYPYIIIHLYMFSFRSILHCKQNKLAD